LLVAAGRIVARTSAILVLERSRDSVVMSKPRAIRRKVCRDRFRSVASGDPGVPSTSSPCVGERSEADLTSWTVVDDWPEPAPVTRAEIDVIETWLTDLLDEIFGPRR
jgi:hypothetical protein